MGRINATLNGIFTNYPSINMGVITPTPWCNGQHNITEERMETYCGNLIQICKNNGIPYFDLFHCSNLRPWNSTNKELMYGNPANPGGVGDGVHPNSNGHMMIASKVEAFLDTLLLH